MKLTKEQVLERLCKICSQLGKHGFRDKRPYNCFCGHDPIPEDKEYEFDEEIITFIETAIEFFNISLVLKQNTEGEKENGKKT